MRYSIFFLFDAFIPTAAKGFDDDRDAAHNQ